MRNVLVRLLITLSTLFIMLMASTLLLVVYAVKFVIAIRYHFPNSHKPQLKAR